MRKSFPLLLVILLGLVLRLIKIDQSFWLDEASQAQLSLLPLSQIWFGRVGDFHPPLFYFLSHFWLQLGRSEVWLRLLPVSFGVATIYVLHLFGQKLKLGILPAFLLSIAPFHIYYSQEFRSYSLLCLLGTLTMYLLHERKFFWLSLINALLLYTHYSSIFLIIAQLCYLIFYSRNDLKQHIYFSLLTLVLYVPWLPQFYKQLQSGTNIDTYLPGWRNVLSVPLLKAFPVIIFKLVAGRITFLSRYLYGAYIVFVLAVTFASLFVSRVKNQFLLIWLFVPLFALLVTSVALPQNQPFRVMFVLPALILLFSFSCQRFPKLFTTLFIYIAIVGNLAYFTRVRLQREQWRQAISFLEKQSGAIVVKFSDKFSPFYWYAPQLPVLAAISSFPAETASVTSKLSSVSGPIYTLDYLGDLTDPGRAIESSLGNMGYAQTAIYDFPGVGFIRKYSQ